VGHRVKSTPGIHPPNVLHLQLKWRQRRHIRHVVLIHVSTIATSAAALGAAAHAECVAERFACSAPSVIHIASRRALKLAQDADAR